MLFDGRKFWIAELNAHAGISLYYYFGIRGEKKRDERNADAVLRALEAAT